jgi:DNA-binding GntR family transcriptional regulator
MAERPVSAAERAFDEIRGAIVSGELAGGTMITESEMAARLGVSRTPVRAALVRLQDDGWVSIFPQRGALVREVGAEEAAHIAEARLLLEAGSVRQLDDDALTALQTELHANLGELEQRLSSGSLDGFVDLDIDFHRNLVEAARNPLLLDFYDRLRDRQALLISRRLSSATRQAAQILAEHRELVSYLDDARWDDFQAGLRAHLLVTRDEAITD